MGIRQTNQQILDPLVFWFEFWLIPEAGFAQTKGPTG
jgi:hypothetical protein